MVASIIRISIPVIGHCKETGGQAIVYPFIIVIVDYRATYI